MTWQKGLLLKGNSMCHGISGNGLLMHTVARWHNMMQAQADEIEPLLGLQVGSFAETMD